MRIKLVGKSTPERIEAVLARLTELQPEGTSWHGVNIYLTLRDEAGEKIELERDGKEIGLLTFADPIKAKRVPAKKQAPKLAQIINLQRNSKAGTP